MKGRLKNSSLALVAMLAIGLVSASAASSQDLLIPASPNDETVLTGTGETEFTIEPDPHLAFTCKSESYTGTFTGPSAKEVTINPTYKECSSNVGPVTIDMNTCDYVLTGSTTGKDHEEKTDATVWVKCSGTNEIKITGSLGCIITVPAQTPTEGGVTYEHKADETKHDLTVNVTATGITYTTNANCQALLGTAVEDNDSTFTGTVTATGYEDEGNTENPHVFEEGSQVDVTVSDDCA